MAKWIKKEKRGTGTDSKSLNQYQKHMEEIEKKSNELPPVVVRRQREGSGKSNDLILENISMVIAGKTLLDTTNVKLAYGKKYGLVGRNGIGKTCLMNALARS